MEEDWLVSLYLYGMHLHNLKHHHKKTKKKNEEERRTEIKGKFCTKWQKNPKISQF